MVFFERGKKSGIVSGQGEIRVSVHCLFAELRVLRFGSNGPLLRPGCVAEYRTHPVRSDMVLRGIERAPTK